MQLRVEIPVGDTTYALDLERAEESTDGKAHWIGRCRIPCAGAFSMQVRRVEAPEAIAERDIGTIEVGTVSQTADGQILLEGVASSTSVDWHGTEMSLDALKGMEQQFKAGVPYVPSHGNDEWDQVFGRTVDATIENGSIMKGAVEDGPAAGYLLRVRTALYDEDVRAQRLLSLLSRGATVGWSIGGWFTDMEVITNDDDEVDRMIIRGVELDHLATTRRPSNPDSWIYEVARSVTEAVKATRTIEDAPNYDVSNSPTQKCGTCVHMSDENWCYENSFTCAPEYVCGKFSQRPEDELFDPVEDPVTDPVGELTDGPNNPDESGRREIEDIANRAATSFANLPLAPAAAMFNSQPSQMDELQDNVLGTLHGGEPDWARYRKAHLWFNKDAPEEKSSYKLAVARMYDPDKPKDVSSVDGQLHVFYDKLQMVQDRLSATTPGIPEEDLEAVLTNLNRYLEKFGAVEDEELGEDESGDAEKVRGGGSKKKKGGGKKGGGKKGGYRDVGGASNLPLHDPLDDPWSFTGKDADEVLGDPPDWARFKKAHAYYDPDKAEIKGGYKLPFAKMSNGKLEAYWRGVAAAMAAVNGARGGVDMPDSDRKKAYTLLSKYYDKADKEAPEYNPSGGRSQDEHDILDNGANMGEKSFSDDALGSASTEVDTVPTNNNEEERVMSDVTSEVSAPVVDTNEAATLEAIGQSMDAMQGILAKLVERDLAREVEAAQETPVPEAPTPTPTTEPGVESLLRAQIELMEEKIERMASRPVRAGYSHSPTDIRSRQPGQMGEFIRTVEESQGGASALAVVCKEQYDRRTTEDPMKLPARTTIERDLRALLEAAHADGVITDPESRNGWR